MFKTTDLNKKTTDFETYDFSSVLAALFLIHKDENMAPTISYDSIAYLDSMYQNSFLKESSSDDKNMDFLDNLIVVDDSEKVIKLICRYDDYLPSVHKSVSKYLSSITDEEMISFFKKHYFKDPSSNNMVVVSSSITKHHTL